MQEPERAADELKRAMSKLGLRGAMIGSHVYEKNLDDPSFEPLWATAEELGAFMFIHPVNVAGADRLKSYYLANLIGNPLDTTIAAACLYFGGVMDRHPKLKIMLAHGGGFTPYQAARWEHGWKVRPEPKKNVPAQPKNIAGRFMYDTILHSGQDAGTDDRAGRQRPRAARQRLSLRHGHGGLRCPRAVIENFRRRQGRHPRRPRRSIVVGEAVMNVQAAAKTGRIPTAAVTGLIVDAMMKSGVPAGDAAKIAELMLEADLTGADAHGVFRLPQYVQRLKLGIDQSAPEYHGQAQRAGHRAGRRRQRHGPSGGRAHGGNRYRARARMRRRLGRLPHVGPCRRCRRLCGAAAQGRYDRHLFGGGQRQPHAARRRRRAAARHQPAGDRDPGRAKSRRWCSTSRPPIVSYGTIKNHKLLNRPLQGDWMIDPKTGAAVTDPQKSAEALLLPMAGYKGAGLALMFGLLAGTLNGALFGRDCVDFNADPGTVTNTGQFVLALDPSKFQPLEQFKAEVDRHIRSLRNSQPLPGGDAVRLPGEQRAKRRADRLANGLALPPELLAQLDRLAGELSIRPLAAR